MPILLNPKWERFAELVEGGKTAKDAYIAAGFKDGPSSRVGACNLQKKPEIAARIDEMRNERHAARRDSLRIASEATGVTKAWVLEQLRKVAVAGLQGDDIYRDGEATGGKKYDRSAANRALELIGKELGMFIERSEWGKPGDFAKEDEDELRAGLIASLIENGVRPEIARAMVRAAEAEGAEAPGGQLN